MAGIQALRKKLAHHCTMTDILPAPPLGDVNKPGKRFRVVHHSDERVGEVSIMEESVYAGPFKKLLKEIKLVSLGDFKLEKRTMFVGSVVLAPHPLYDKEYGRGLIEQVFFPSAVDAMSSYKVIEAETVKVTFLDTGGSYIIPVEELKPLSMNMLKHPVLAYKVMLYNDVKPGGGPTMFQLRGALLNKTLMAYMNKLRDEKLFVHVLKSRQSNNTSSEETCPVLLQSGVGKTRVNLTNELNKLPVWEWERLVLERKGGKLTDKDIARLGADYRESQDVGMIKLTDEFQLEGHVTRFSPANMKCGKANAYLIDVKNPVYENFRNVLEYQLERYTRMVDPSPFTPALKEMFLIKLQAKEEHARKGIPNLGKWCRAVKKGGKHESIYLIDFDCYIWLDLLDSADYEMRAIFGEFLQIPTLTLKIAVEEQEGISSHGPGTSYVFRKVKVSHGRSCSCFSLIRLAKGFTYGFTSHLVVRCKVPSDTSSHSSVGDRYSWFELKMLYYFPNESAEELEVREAVLLGHQIKNAARVQTCGYRKKECVLPSFYVETRCMKYLGCEIDDWALPATPQEKVYLESLPTNFLPPMWKLNKPLKFKEPGTNQLVHRIVGFREILQKREHVEYLKEVKGDGPVSMQNDDEDGGMDDTVAPSALTTKELLKERVPSATNGDPMGLDQNESLIQIARGGGKGSEQASKQNKGTSEKISTKKNDAPNSHKGSKKGASEGGKSSKDAKTEKSGKTKVSKASKSEKSRKSKDKRKSGKKDKSQKKSHEQAGKNKKSEKKSKEPKKAPKTKVKKMALGQYFKSKGTGYMKGVGKILQEIEDNKVKLEKEHRENLEAIIKFHKMFHFPPVKQMDSEWLELSDTDPEAPEPDDLKKPMAPWMDEAISYESQYLARTLRVFMVLTEISGRSFFRVVPDEGKGHMNFAHKKKRSILYFVTSIICWICFCLIGISLIAIRVEGLITPLRQGDKRNPSREDLAAEYIYAAKKVEEIQLETYEVLFYYFFIQLAFVALSSVLIVLGDGINISHYFNCWCAALAEMETSSCMGITKLIIGYHIVWLIISALIITANVLGYPAHFWEANVLIIGLIVRPFHGNLRIGKTDFLPYWGVAGLVFQIYTYYCAMLIKLLIAILARILKNSSEMWNFKFALTFRQLATRNRGQLLRLGLNQSLLKLFQHHRILTVLLRNFGEVFTVPIMLFQITECAIGTLVCVQWFFYDAAVLEKFYQVESVIAETNINGKPRPKDDIKIYHYHSPQEVHLVFCASCFMLLVQFIPTTEILAQAGNAFFSGYEFVRRSGTILCRTSHERRLIQSLEWSFSSTDPSVLSVSSYYPVNREMIVTAFSVVMGIFSLIIQLQPGADYSPIEFNLPEECSSVDMDTRYGECVAKESNNDYSLNFADADSKFPVGNSTISPLHYM